MCNSSGGIVGKLLTPPVSSRIEISGPHVRAASWEGDQDGALYSWALGVCGGEGQSQPLLLVLPFCIWVQLWNQINLGGHQGNLGNLFVKKYNSRLSPRLLH